MNFLVTFIQVLSSILAITSAYGLFGIPEKIQEYGIQVSQLEIALGLSLTIAILSLIFGHKIKRSDVGRDKKTQVQLGGKNNEQNMK